MNPGQHDSELKHGGPILPSNNNAQKPWVQVVASQDFTNWLIEQKISLAFTTYQTGKLFFAGCKSDHSLAIFERSFAHCMGLWSSDDAQTLWLSTKFQLWRFSRSVAQGIPFHIASDTAQDQKSNVAPAWTTRGYDYVYLPRVGFTTGNIDMHDVAVTGDGQVIFVSTLFSCLATVSEHSSFRPLWHPSFVTELFPEDRCHLNGLAMKNGVPAFVTVVARTNTPDGWRDHRLAGGCVIEVANNEVVAHGLSMPHSPRWYRDRLWVLNSGCGEFGFIDLATGKFQAIAFCPGYLRGMAFIGDFAIVTLSKPRYADFQGLPLDKQLTRYRVEAQCGLHVIDLRSGNIAHRLEIEGSLVTELYDTVILSGVRQPMAIGFISQEIEQLISIDHEGTS